MTHKTREALDEQQKQSSMTAEELLFELDQIRIKYKGQKFDIEKGSPRIDESIELINQSQKGQIINFNKWLSDNHSSFEISDRIVQEYIKWNILPD